MFQEHLWVPAFSQTCTDSVCTGTCGGSWHTELLVQACTCITGYKTHQKTVPVINIVLSQAQFCSSWVTMQQYGSSGSILENDILRFHFQFEVNFTFKNSALL